MRPHSWGTRQGVFHGMFLSPYRSDMGHNSPNIWTFYWRNAHLVLTIFSNRIET